jgi:dehydrogenase/reductase SDR family member 12
MTLARWASRLGDALLDPSIVFSFDRTGYQRHAKGFDPEDSAHSLRGRVIAITGANAGIGFATTRALAERGATLWMLCRSEARGRAAAERIIAEFPDTSLHVVPLDLAEPESVGTVLSRVPGGALDVLVHNAGVLPRTYEETAWGLERTLATNLVAPFRLTSELLPRLELGTEARIIWVSSGGMYTQRLEVDALTPPEVGFDGVIAYARTKRAMVVLSEQLAERLKGRGVAVHAMHPGWADTPGVESSIPGFWKLTQKILRSPVEGADTVIWLAACDKAQAQSGRFWFDRKARSTHLLGKRAAPGEGGRLWGALHRWAQMPQALDARGRP